MDETLLYQYSNELIHIGEELSKNKSIVLIKKIKVLLYLYFCDNYQLFLENRKKFKNNLNKEIEYYFYFLHYIRNPVKYNFSIIKEEKQNNSIISIPRAELNIVDDFSLYMNKEYKRVSLNNNMTNVFRFLFPTFGKSFENVNLKEQTLFFINKNQPKEMQLFLEKKIPVSNYIYEKICKIKKLEKKNEIGKQNIKKMKSINSVSLLSLQNSLLKVNTTEDITEANFELTKMQEKIIELENNIYQMKLNAENLLIEKKCEKKTFFEKEYCKKTIFLDIAKMKKILNEDNLFLISEYVGKSMIENTRRLIIQEKYFKNDEPKYELRYNLNKWSKINLQRYYDKRPFLKFNLSVITDIYDYLDEITSINIDNYIINYHFYQIYDNFQRYKKWKTMNKQRLINLILNVEKIKDYYPFQRDILILTKILYPDSDIDSTNTDDNILHLEMISTSTEENVILSSDEDTDTDTITT